MSGKSSYGKISHLGEWTLKVHIAASFVAPNFTGMQKSRRSSNILDTLLHILELHYLILKLLVDDGVVIVYTSLASPIHSY